MMRPSQLHNFRNRGQRRRQNLRSGIDPVVVLLRQASNVEAFVIVGICRVEVHLELIDVGGDVRAAGVCCESGLLHAEQSGSEGVYTFLLKSAARLYAFPCTWDLDTDTMRWKDRTNVLVERYDACRQSTDAFLIMIGVDYTHVWHW